MPNVRNRSKEAWKASNTNLNKNIPITIFFECIRIQNFILGDVTTTILVLSHKLLVRIASLRVLVEKLHVRMSRSGVQVIVQLFDIFTVISLMTCNAEKAFLENGVLTIPKGEPKAKALMVIRDSSDPVFTPSVGARTRLLMRKVAPGITISGIIFANGSLSMWISQMVRIGRPRRTHPLSVTEVRAPSFPVSFLLFILEEPVSFCTLVLLT